jgi:hypothetical protein
MTGWAVGGGWWAPSTAPPPPGAIVDDFGRVIAPGHFAGWGIPSGATCDATPITWDLASISPDVDHVVDATDFDRTTLESVSAGAGHTSAEIVPYPALGGGSGAGSFSTVDLHLGVLSIPCTMASEALITIAIELAQVPSLPAVPPDALNNWYDLGLVFLSGDGGGGAGVQFRRDFNAVGGLVSAIRFTDDDADPVTIAGDFADVQAITIDRSTSRGTTRITTTATGLVELPLIYFDPGFPEDLPYIVGVRHEGGVNARGGPAIGYDNLFSLAASGLVVA